MKREGLGLGVCLSVRPFFIQIWGILLDSVLPDRALQVLPVLGSPSPSVLSLKFMGVARAGGLSSIAGGGASPVTTDSSPCKRES